MTRIVVYYDQTCNMCHWFKQAFHKLRRPSLVVEWRHYEEAPACGIDDYACGESMKVQTTDGQLYHGFYAVRVLLGYSWLFWLKPLLYLPGAAHIGERAYAWVARNRIRLFGSKEL